MSNSVMCHLIRMWRAEHNLRKFWGSSGWREHLSWLVTKLSTGRSSFAIAIEDVEGGGMLRCSPSGSPSIICEVAFRLAASRVKNQSTNAKQKRTVVHLSLSLSCLVLCCDPHPLYLMLCGDPKFFDLLSLQCRSMLLSETSFECSHSFLSLGFHIHKCLFVIGLLMSLSFSFCFSFIDQGNAPTGCLWCSVCLQQGFP